MSDLGLHIKATGLLMLMLAIAHIFFPHHFKWKEEFKPLSLLSSQVMYVHTFFIALIVFLNGVLCFVYAADLLEKTALSKAIATGMLVFWGIRFLFQFFVYSPKLWKGKKFETYIHILFSSLWLYFTVVFSLLVKNLAA